MLRRQPGDAGSAGAPDTATIVLGCAALVSGAAAVGGEVALREGLVIVPGPVAVLDAALAWLLLSAAIVRAAVLRRRERESPRIRRGLTRLIVGTAILYPGLALVTILEEWASPDAAFVVDTVATFSAVPFLIAALFALCWPLGFSRNQVRVLVADVLVGSLGLVVLWLLIVGPVAFSHDPARPGWTAANLTAMMIVGILLVILASASRRRAAIPARQVVLLHGFALAHLVAGVGELMFPSGLPTSVKEFYFGSVIGGALLMVFLLAPTGQAETLRETRARELYAAAVPLVPIPLASLALVGVLVTESKTPGTTEILGGLLLILLLLSVVVLRALASAELRRAARQSSGNRLTTSTEEEWFQVLVGRTQDLTLVLHRDGRIAYATPSVYRATGLGPAELRGQEFFRFLSSNPASEKAVHGLMARADVTPGQPTEAVDLLLRGASGAGREVEWRFTALVGLDIEGYLVHGRDVTDERRMRALLAESVSRDTLTRLHTRQGFLAATAERRGKRSVLVVNLRRFADFNDQFGHPAGDYVLRQVAQILRDLPGPVNDPARLSADTFAVLVSGSVPDIEVVSAAASIRDALRLVNLPDGRPLPLGVAAGYSVSDTDDIPMGELLSRAEVAMTRSRVLERTPLVRFDPTMRLARDAATAAEADLRSALRDRALVVRYQPIVRLTDGAVVGAEALVRRRRSDGSLESPEVFIPLAEQLGLVDEVDTAVLMRALNELSEVASTTGRRLPVSVNVSASELDDGLEHRVLDALASTGWHPEHLIIEVTETALATRTDEASRLLRRLQNAGCLVAMDDFGTGYSSMASLVEMPVDIVKIDASFTHRLTAAGRGLSVMRAIVEIGRSLNLVTVAEGLATVEQADLLRGMGCDRGQGYLYAPPLTAEDLAEYLRPDNTIVTVD